MPIVALDADMEQVTDKHNYLPFQMRIGILIWYSSTPPYTSHHTGAPGLNCFWSQFAKLLYTQHNPLKVFHITETIDLIGINIQVS